MKLELTYTQLETLNKLTKDFGHVTTRELLREALIIKIDGWNGVTLEVDDAILLDCLNEKEDGNV